MMKKVEKHLGLIVGLEKKRKELNIKIDRLKKELIVLDVSDFAYRVEFQNDGSLAFVDDISGDYEGEVVIRLDADEVRSFYDFLCIPIVSLRKEFKKMQREYESRYEEGRFAGFSNTSIPTKEVEFVVAMEERRVEKFSRRWPKFSGRRCEFRYVLDIEGGEYTFFLEGFKKGLKESVFTIGSSDCLKKGLAKFI